MLVTRCSRILRTRADSVRFCSSGFDGRGQKRADNLYPGHVETSEFQVGEKYDLKKNIDTRFCYMRLSCY